MSFAFVCLSRLHTFTRAVVSLQVPREAYLAALSTRDYYGAALFVVKQTYTRVHPRKLLLGISRRGILLLKIPKSPTDGVMETLSKYPLADIYRWEYTSTDKIIQIRVHIVISIYRWAYKPGVNFYFEIKAEDSHDEHPIHTFETIEGKHMSDMLTDYAMALLREMGLNADGTKRVRSRDRMAASVAAASAAPPSAAPGIAASPDSYKSVAGDVGSLATAAVRSGDYSAAGTGAGECALPCCAAPCVWAALANVDFVVVCGVQAHPRRPPHSRLPPRRPSRLPLLARPHCQRTGRKSWTSPPTTTTTSTASLAIPCGTGMVRAGVVFSAACPSHYYLPPRLVLSVQRSLRRSTVVTDIGGLCWDVCI